MRCFCFFYQNSTGYVEGTIPPRFDKAHVVPIQACGTDAVLRIDDRLPLGRKRDIAVAECRRRKYIGYRLERGGSILHTWPLHPFEAVRPAVQDLAEAETALRNGGTDIGTEEKEKEHEAT